MGKLKVHVTTIGCRANQADSAVLTGYLDPGLAVAGDESNADIFIINTCCVTTEAERDCKKTARRLLRNNPKAKVVFTGCAVTAFTSFADEFDERVLSAGGGATSPADLAQWINQYAAQGNMQPVPPPTKSRDYTYFNLSDEPPFRSASNIEGRTRALLKIQNGCTHNCTYCIVPKARGPEQSMPIEMVLNQVQRAKESGAMELVFTGVQIGAWGKELPGKPSLARLLDDAADIFAPGRIRLSSIEPWSVNDELIDAVARNDRICNHLHIPLQSGDDGVLDDMRRGYRAAEWLKIVQLAKQRIPGIAIGTDVICGFPTESDGAFEESLRVVLSSEISYVHGFSYSRRPGTVAAKKYGENREVAKIRVRKMRALGDKLREAYVLSKVGTTAEILTEDNSRGITDTFLQVELRNAMPNTFVTATLERCRNAPDSLCAKTDDYATRHP